jgi:predicted nucleic acid-binding protein
VTAVVIDASVWVAAVDSREPGHAVARRLLSDLSDGGTTILVPSLMRVEVACALTRRLGDPAAAMAQVAALLDAPFIVEIPLDRGRAVHAASMGAERRLRGADAVYAALAHAEGATLVTLDRDMRERANAIAPEEWRRAHPRE